MQKLLEPNTVPPDGYRYQQAETRTWIRAPDYHNLFVSVAEHRKANNLPLGTFWEAEVEDQLCQSLPPGQCKQSIPGQGRNVFTRIGWEDVVAGTATLVNWAGAGFPKVDQNLADTRANVCSRCYFNVQMQGGCHSCGQVASLASSIVGIRRTSSDPFLKACAVCKCSLQVKVWTPIDAIAKGTRQDQYDRFPNFCWVRRELDQYRKDNV